MGISVWNHLKNEAENLVGNAFSGISTLADWQAARPQLRQEFRDCLGLGSVPALPRALQVREFSNFSGIGYRARNIGFELLPDCWASAAIYYPTPSTQKAAPAVLYVCGHAEPSRIGVWHYQQSAILWARRGYVCLILDTIEQHDNPGEHHGATTGRMDSWLALGYSSAGGEAWNALRALEVLRQDPAVDPNRIGVTGISGGGAVSFYVAVLDDRVAALSSLCGVSTPRDAILNQRLYCHCDCMYPHNIFRRDLSEYAALLAPRAALFCFGRNDILFCPRETEAFVDRVRSIYRLYEKEDHCQLVDYPCGHENHPHFVEKTQKWFDQHVAGEEHPLLGLGEREISQSQASVFQGRPPQPNHMALLPELLSSRAVVPLPATSQEWPEVRHLALSSLSLPKAPASFLLDGMTTWEIDANKASHIRISGTVDGADVVLEGVHRKGSRKFLMGLVNCGESFQVPLGKVGSASLEISCGVYQCRLSGGNFPPQVRPSYPLGAHPQDPRSRLIRAMALIGETPVTLFYQDCVAAMKWFENEQSLQGLEIYLYGRAEAGIGALYCALLDERIAGVIVEDFPASQVEGVPILAGLKSFDLSQAIGLMAPRKMSVVGAGHHNWVWARQVYQRLNCEDHLVMASDLATAFKSMFI